MKMMNTFALKPMPSVRIMIGIQAIGGIGRTTSNSGVKKESMPL